MSVSASFLEYVLEQMSASRRTITHRRMFGGMGIYADERFIAVIDDDRLYLKTDETTRPLFEQEGSVPFRPYGEGSYSMSYYEAPVHVLETRTELSEWIELSWSAAGGKRQRKKRAPDRSRQR